MTSRLVSEHPALAGHRDVDAAREGASGLNRGRRKRDLADAASRWADRSYHTGSLSGSRTGIVDVNYGISDRASGAAERSGRTRRKLVSAGLEIRSPPRARRQHHADGDGQTYQTPSLTRESRPGATGNCRPPDTVH